MSLCILQNVKDYLKKTDAESDALIEMLIPAAEGFIESYCRRNFDSETTPAEVTEYHHGGVNRIFLNQFPVAPSPALKLYEDSSRVFGDSTLVDPADYYVDYNAGIVFVDYDLDRGWGSIKAVYKPVAVPAGEQPTGEIAVARQACIEIVARKLKTGSSGDIGVMSRTSSGGTTVVFSMDDILPETKIALDSISRPL